MMTTLSNVFYQFGWLVGWFVELVVVVGEYKFSGRVFGGKREMDSICVCVSVCNLVMSGAHWTREKVNGALVASFNKRRHRASESRSSEPTERTSRSGQRRRSAAAAAALPLKASARRRLEER